MARDLRVTDAEMVALAVEGLASVCEGDAVEGMRLLDEAAATALAGGAVVRPGPRMAGRLGRDVRGPPAALRGHAHVARRVGRGGGPARGLHRRAPGVPSPDGGGGEGAARRAPLAAGSLGGGRSPVPRGRTRSPVAARPRPARAGPGRRGYGREPGRAGSSPPPSRRPHRARPRARVEGPCARRRRTPGRRSGALRELQEIAGSVRTDPLRARASLAAGAIAAARDEPDAAACFEDAVDFCHRAGAAFEGAGARTRLARALLSLGRVEAATQEADAALRVFRRLNAAREAASASRTSASGATPPARPPSASEPDGRRKTRARRCAWPSCIRPESGLSSRREAPSRAGGGCGPQWADGSRRGWRGSRRAAPPAGSR